MPAPDDQDRRLVRRERPVSGPVEDYNPPAEDEEGDGPSADDVARFGDVTVKCPECGTELYDDVALCWKCGRRAVGAGTPEDSKSPPLWIMITVIVVICLLVLWATRGVF